MSASPDLVKPERILDGELPPEQVPDPRVAILQSETATPAAREGAFAELVTDFEGRLTGFVTGMIGPNDAEDIVQLTFLRAHQSMGRFENRGEASLTAWFYKTARNLTLNYVRDSKRDTLDQSVHEALESSAVSRRASRIGDPEARLEFQGALAVLGEIHGTQRTAMIRKAAGYSQEEIADMQAVTVPAVKGLLVRGREKAADLREKAAA